MRRKRNGSGRDVLIDLTSLLDVIFILLLIVLWGQNNKQEELTRMQAETEQAKVQAEADSRLYAAQQELADNLNKFVCAVSVEVPYDKKDVTKRTIQILAEGGELERFTLAGNQVEDSVASFRESLVRVIQENKDKPVILCLNEKDDNILYRDEKMVTELFAELAKEYNNVYIRGSISGEAK